MWHCPLNNRSDCNENHAISSDGGLRHFERMMQPELAKLGWQMVNFPKRSYYMEFDKTHPSYKEKESIGLEDATEILQVEVV